jgi:hypothetical protein
LIIIFSGHFLYSKENKKKILELFDALKMNSKNYTFFNKMSLDQFLDSRMNVDSVDADEEFIIKRCKCQLQFDSFNGGYSLRIPVNDFPYSQIHISTRVQNLQKRSTKYNFTIEKRYSGMDDMETVYVYITKK